MNDWSKMSWWMVLSFCSNLALAAPPPLPIAGDLTDPAGQPLNETVNLTFSLSESASGDPVLWTETLSKVPVVQGRFAVLLGAKQALEKTEGHPIDFTLKKYITVKIERMEQPAYTLTPPLIYSPALGAWQAKHADEANNSSKLETHGWKDIKDIEGAIYSELNKLKKELNNTKKQLEDTKQQFNTKISTVQTALNTFQNKSSERLNQLDNFVSTEKAAINVAFFGGQYGKDCPNGWTNQGTIAWIHLNNEPKTVFYAQGAGLTGSPGWSWTHIYLCRRNGY